MLCFVIEKYLHCVTCPELLQHLATKPQLLRCHLQHIAQLLPTLTVPYLIRVAQLYDPCHPAASLAVRHVVTSRSQRYFSMSSLSSISSDSLEFSHGVRTFNFYSFNLNHNKDFQYCIFVFLRMMILSAKKILLNSSFLSYWF